MSIAKLIEPIGCILMSVYRHVYTYLVQIQLIIKLGIDNDEATAETELCFFKFCEQSRSSSSCINMNPRAYLYEEKTVYFPSHDLMWFFCRQFWSNGIYCGMLTPRTICPKIRQKSRAFFHFCDLIAIIGALEWLCLILKVKKKVCQNHKLFSLITAATLTPQ